MIVYEDDTYSTTQEQVVPAGAGLGQLWLAYWSRQGTAVNPIDNGAGTLAGHTSLGTQQVACASLVVYKALADGDAGKTVECTGDNAQRNIQLTLSFAAGETLDDVVMIEHTGEASGTTYSIAAQTVTKGDVIFVCSRSDSNITYTTEDADLSLVVNPAEYIAEVAAGHRSILGGYWIAPADGMSPVISSVMSSANSHGWAAFHVKTNAPTVDADIAAKGIHEDGLNPYLLAAGAPADTEVVGRLNSLNGTSGVEYEKARRDYINS